MIRARAMRYRRTRREADKIVMESEGIGRLVRFGVNVGVDCDVHDPIFLTYLTGVVEGTLDRGY